MDTASIPASRARGTIHIANGTDGIAPPGRYIAIATMAFAVFMASLDSSIVNVALPDISRTTHSAASDTVWIASAYQMTTAIFLLPLASLGEVRGYRLVYLIGLAVFTLASLGAGFSNSLDGLTAWRAIQGIGAAGILSVNTAILRFVYPRTQLGRGVGINAFIAAASATAGPPLGSLILSMTNWHGLFLINIPVGAVAFCLGLYAIPHNARAKRSFDIRSALLGALVFGLLLAATNGVVHGAPAAFIVAELVAFLPLACLHINRERLSSYPLFPLDLLRIRLFRLSVMTSICSFTAQMLAFVLLPFALTPWADFQGISVGFLIAPWPAATTACALIAGSLADRMPAGMLGGLGLLLFSAGLASFAFLPVDHSIIGVAARMALCGAGFGLFQSPNNKIILGSAPASRAGSASGMMGTARLLGQSLGSALAASCLAVHTAHAMTLAMLLAASIALLGAAIGFLRLLGAGMEITRSPAR